jgi:hypothetical protein
MAFKVLLCPHPNDEDELHILEKALPLSQTRPQRSNAFLSVPAIICTSQLLHFCTLKEDWPSLNSKRLLVCF